MPQFELIVVIQDADAELSAAVTLAKGKVLTGSGNCSPIGSAYIAMNFRHRIGFHIPGGSAMFTGVVEATDVVGGTIEAEPPANVPIQITIHGRRAIGSYTLPARQAAGRFEFKIPADAEALPDDETVTPA